MTRGIANQVFESSFSDDHDKVGDPVGAADPHDHGISREKIPIDPGMGGEILVGFLDLSRSEFRG
jgi:hypothetical protein